MHYRVNPIVTQGYESILKRCDFPSTEVNLAITYKPYFPVTNDGSIFVLAVYLRKTVCFDPRVFTSFPNIVIIFVEMGEK